MEGGSEPAPEIPSTDVEAVTVLLESTTTLVDHAGPDGWPMDDTGTAPRPRDRKFGDMQAVFTSSLLTIVSAYTLTGSAVVTVVAAVVALLVTLIIGRRK